MSPFNRTEARFIDFLLSRRSSLARHLCEPGPDPATLTEILRAGLRVPDHGKIAPWRLIVVEGEARQKFGQAISAFYRQEEKEPSDVKARLLEDFPVQAPVMIIVVSRLNDVKPIPDWEQILSAGACCFALLTAAQSLGFGAQWLTGWAAYSRGVKSYLNLEPSDRIAGFVFVGRNSAELRERGRPELAEVVSFLGSAD